MKKIVLFTFCLFLISKFNFSQSFALLDSIGTINVTSTIVTVPITANASYATYFKIKNNTSNNINYRVDRVYLTPPICSGNDIYYCAAGQCFPPDTSTVYSSSADVILANQTLPSDPTNFGILADYIVGPNCCAEDVLYKVINLNNPNDTAIVTIRYTCVSGINDFENKGGTISTAYPNPSNSFISIKYNITADSKSDKIVFYDISGKVVKEVSLQNKQGVSKIDISDISAGTYFYSLTVNDKAIQTKKLIVSSK